jgi:hypothetical protein
MRFAIPAITAGNGVLLKHSPNVTGCALALEQLFIDAGLPKGVVTTMVVAEPDVPDVIDRLIQDGFEPRRGCSGCRRGTSIEEVRARTRRFGCFHHS